MAMKPFDRRVIRTRERPLSTDLNELATWLHYSLTETLDQMASRREVSFLTDAPGSLGPYTCFMGDGFRVKATVGAGGSREIKVSKGLGFWVDAADTTSGIGSGDSPPLTGVDDARRYRPLVLDADQAITVPTGDGTHPRIDIIEVKLARRQADSLSRQILNTTTGQFDPTAVNKTLTFSFDGQLDTNGTGAGTAYINLKTGTPAAVPTAPTVTAGYVKIAEIDMAQSASEVVDAKATAPHNTIRDQRLIFAPHGQLSVAGAAGVSFATAQVTSHSVMLPPGCKAAMYRFDTGKYRVVVVAGGDAAFAALSARVNMLVTAADAAGGGPFFYAQLIGKKSDVMGTSMRNTLATSANVFPKIYVAENQRYVEFEFMETSQSAAITGAAAKTTNYEFDWALDIRM